jgi:hypothetical protein
MCPTDILVSPAITREDLMNTNRNISAFVPNCSKMDKLSILICTPLHFYLLISRETLLGVCKNFLAHNLREDLINLLNRYRIKARTHILKVLI